MMLEVVSLITLAIIVAIAADLKKIKRENARLSEVAPIASEIEYATRAGGAPRANPSGFPQGQSEIDRAVKAIIDQQSGRIVTRAVYSAIGARSGTQKSKVRDSIKRLVKTQRIARPAAGVYEKASIESLRRSKIRIRKAKYGTLRAEVLSYAQSRGGEFSIRDLVRDRPIAGLSTRDSRNSWSNACAHHALTGDLIRVSRGVYRISTPHGVTGKLWNTYGPDAF